jgi:hypothetical protein
MTTRRELILARLKTNLDAITGATVYRNRVEPLARGEVPAVIVEPINDEPIEEFSSKLQWTFRVRVTVLVRANAPGNAADAYVKQVHDAVMSDTTINGYALDIDPATTDFSFFDADVPVGIIAMDYLIKYRTSRVDLTSP